MVQPLLDVSSLYVDLPIAAGRVRAVRDLSFKVSSGETLCIVGESGSGKSMTARAIMGLLPPNAERRAARIEFQGTEMQSLSASALRKLTGDRMAMVFQDPMTSFNPVFTLGNQLTEAYLCHRTASRKEAQERAEYLVDRVGIPQPRRRLEQFPHQLSGGMRQRMMIAMALMCGPQLLFADEPTTALDVTIQAQVLDLLDDLRREFNMGLVLITHDFGVVARMADRVQVMYSGEVIEQGNARDVIHFPQHPYTRGLIASRPEGQLGLRLRAIRGTVPSLMGSFEGCAFAPRCDFVIDACRSGSIALEENAHERAKRCLLPSASGPDVLAQPNRTHADAEIRRFGTGTPSEPALSCRSVSHAFRLPGNLLSPGAKIQAVKDVSFSIASGEVVAIVGESGSGKSTLARIMLGIQKPDLGEVFLGAKPIGHLSSFQIAQIVQPVFQDPFSSLNPAKTIGATIATPLEVLRIGTRKSREERVEELMDQFGLPPRLRHSYPGQLSGGQRQRVAICRALASSPSVLVCDEPTSALDVSIQAQILNLLQDLREKMGVALVLISHDLGVVRHMADRVAVMHEGRFVEEGITADIFDSPQHPYTTKLLGSMLSIGTAKEHK